MQQHPVIPRILFIILAAGLLSACNELSNRPDHATQATNRALLIGIGDYAMAPLEGPPNDVAALRDVLPQWGFAPQNITVLTNQQATRAAILAALSQLADNAQADDKILIYFSGHGTSAQDPNFGQWLPLPHTSGALVPADFVSTSGQPEDLARHLIVGRSDMRPLFERMDRTGAQVLAIFDACYSGNTVRDFRPGVRPRLLDLGFLPTNSVARAFAREPYPYRNLIYLGAASESQPALDLGGAEALLTVDGRPHGAFTNTLLRVLREDVVADANGDWTVSPAELQAVIRPLVSRNYPQTPQLLPGLHEDPANNEERGFFTRGAGIATTPTPAPERTPVLFVWLDKLLPWHIRGLERIPGVAAAGTGGRADVKIVQEGAEIQMVLPNGHPLARYSSVDGAAIQQALAQQGAAQPLRLLHHANAGFQIQLERGGSGRDGMAIEGSLVGFAVRAPRAVYYLALDIDPEGRVSVLYPATDAELAQIPANGVVDLGGQIRVKGPFGTDYVKVFAFAQLPPGLTQWVGQTGIAPGDARFNELACLVGLATPGSGGSCPADGIAEATFTLSTYPANEVSRHF